ncbi:uncharacterized protein LOC130963392 [Arachis stenosperma]|uniref:uncharacterized protein LOC130963392 n=1 Tax=Arachis stenosperma TaxID=217475 RepID=UPI0025AD2CEC|nr:uncharacterized protein LOC130963392 [Arachis stenosperma]
MSPYFQDMLDGVAGIRPGYKGPSYDKLRVHLLADLKRESQMLVDSYRSAWKETGCTLMADGWIDQRQRTLINFLVYCSKGLCFVKSVDASSMVKNASHLCNLFSEVIEWIGPNNIVHVVTDNAVNYVAAGRLINRKYDNIYWSPCAAHCLNLILKDISSMAHISNLATRVSKITVFVYNHTVFLSWLRQRPHWREIVRPGAIRFATVFITLKTIFDRKKELQQLVVDSIFTNHKLGRSATDEWWSLFRGSAPCLQKIAVRILSQASASSRCERNWSLFDQIHTKRRNRLEHDRLNDIVYVTYNLRLKSRKKKEKRKQKTQYDPIDYESEIDADLYQSGGGSSGLYAASLDSSADQGGNEGEDHPTEADLQQVLANFDD